MPQIYSIAQINEYLKNALDGDALLQQVAIRGEISNYKLYPSGHHYFTLKDEGAAMKCVMFQGNARTLRFRPQNGMKVVAMGRITLYPRDGAVQLYCTAMMVDGVGDLHAAFEQLKEKLQKQGLFDPAHKKPLPKYPGTIGIVTSEAGAAVHDMLRILRKRFPLVRVVLLPVRVQGAEAPGEIAGAIAYANHYALADLLIVGRGGGSMEDLWAFNEEIVARAIYDSRIPIISAVGHEPDVTIADYVADLRAATPSNGAELAVPDRDALMQNLDGVHAAMAASLARQLKSAKKQLETLVASPVLSGPTGYLETKAKNLELLKNRLAAAENQIIARSQREYIASVSKLDALSPMKVIGRGYAIAQKIDGAVLRSVQAVQPGDALELTLSDGTLRAEITDIRRNSHE